MHWSKWNRLCVSKQAGKLGFRDMSTFNHALLAKQCWRLCKNSSCLSKRVLKGCYRRSTDCLEAESKSNASYVWQSPMWWRELLEMGTRWRIGDMYTVHIYKDWWIPRPTTFKRDASYTRLCL
ncbi:hypothetical protein Dsin_008368 [Dipteronia sinensis]|uniref:Uncharacterized protein n=1 Tax=Dipteronia sinensis TaxID=43782 RepID=A0AAE0AP17_9ROSI|nr:hypothetical protein Dsin_008368 [Dipteronia sinensis]